MDRPLEFAWRQSTGGRRARTAPRVNPRRTPRIGRGIVMTSRRILRRDGHARGVARVPFVPFVAERARGHSPARASPPPPSSQPPRPDPALESIPIDIIIVFSPPRRRSRFAIHRARERCPALVLVLVAARRRRAKPNLASSSRRVSLVTRRRRRRRIGRAETRREPRRSLAAVDGDVRRRASRDGKMSPRANDRGETRATMSEDASEIARDVVDEEKTRVRAALVAVDVDVARTREGRWRRRSGDWRRAAAGRTIRACERYDESSGDTEG